MVVIIRFVEHATVGDATCVNCEHTFFVFATVNSESSIQCFSEFVEILVTIEAMSHACFQWQA